MENCESVTSTTNTNTDDSIAEAVQNLQIDNDITKEDEDKSTLQQHEAKYFLDILAQYKEAVKHKEKHAAFLKDSVVGPFLTLSMASKDAEIVLKALEIIEVLLENVQNHYRLQNLLHFLDAADDIVKNESMPQEAKTSAAKIYDVVHNAKMPLGPVRGPNDPNVSASAQRDNRTGDDKVSQSQRPSRKSGKVASTARVTHLSVPSVLIRERRNLITSALVKVKGIISVTYNVNKQQCIIRAKSDVAPKHLGLQIANLGFDCSLITKNEKNEEVLVPIKSQHEDEKLNPLNSTCKFEKENAPQYFPEEEDEVSENAVAPLGFNDDKDKQDGKGWWGSASKIIRNKLFW